MKFTGNVYRAHNPRWSHAPTSGEGARLYGGRFNPKGVPALYTSTTQLTAIREAQQGFPFKPAPLTICAYDVNCTDVADLTSPAGVKELSPEAQALADRHVLACAWEDLSSRKLDPPSWQLARQLVKDGWAGVLVPSFATGAVEGDTNIVFWTWAADPPHQVRVIDPGNDLPRNDLSWR